MEPILRTAVDIVIGLLIGSGASYLIYRRRVRLVHLLWQANFSNCVNQAIAHMFGGRVENGVIYLPHGDEVEDDQDDEAPPDKDKLN